MTPGPNPPTPPTPDAKAKQVLGLALDAPTGQREQVIAEACAGDPGLLDRVTCLLRAAEKDDAFLSDATHGGKASSMVRADEEAPGARIGPYRLLEPLGEGGFGSVFLADQEHPVRRRVALKVIKLGMDTRAVVARFEQERQALAVMDHPNIAKVFDAGATASGRPYFVMEFVAGRPITEYCDGARLSIPERIELFRQVCAAVQHAHTKGIIHRDLKPGNVLVAVHDGAPVAKVIDFGIAKATERHLTEHTVFTEARQLVGTPEYMSPEQASGSRDIDTRSDVYALGVMLYELLIGATPFDPRRLRSAAFAEVQRMIREDDPPRPSTRLSMSTQDLPAVAARRRTEPGRLGSLVKGELDWIVMRAMEKDRTRRYDSPAALGADLARFLSGRAVEAAPPGMVYRAGKFIRRHRGPVVGAGAVLLALLLGVAGTVTGLVRARGERDRAERNAARAITEASRSEAVAGFLTDMLRGVGPAAAQGRDTSVLREILDKTAARLDTDEFKNAPTIEADLRHTLGVVYSDLGDRARAITMHRRALALRTGVEGENSEDVALIMNDLAKALWDDSQFPEAERLLRRAVEVRTKLFGPDDPKLATSLGNLGMLLQKSGDMDGAETNLKRAIDIKRRANGPRCEEVANALANLGVVLDLAERLPEAEAAAREAVSIAREHHGDHHPDVAFALNVLGMVLLDEEQPEDALPLLREALKIRREVLTPGHQDIGASTENLAACIQTLAGSGAPGADLNEAVALNKEAVAIYRTGPNAHSVVMGRTLFALARGLRRTGDLPGAEAAARECLAIRSALDTPQNPERWLTENARAMVGDLLGDQDRFKEGEAFWVAAVTNMRTVVPGMTPDDPRAQGALQGLVAFYRRWDKAHPGEGHDAKASEWEAKAAPTK